MPLRDCKFQFYGGLYRPVLPVKIINPHTGGSVRTWGIIDTGADECAIPEKYAALLGHDLKAGRLQKVSTGSGTGKAYSHTTRIEVFHPQKGGLAHTLHDTPIDFIEGLDEVLLGVRHFLSEFILQIDYPRLVFSVTAPEVHPKGV